MIAAFITAAASLGGCAVDLPPGDVATMTLSNDLTSVVSFASCADARCTRRYDVTGSGPVLPGQGVAWNHEMCGQESVGVLDSSGRLLGCVVLPAQDPAKLTRFYASAAAPCR